MPSSSLYAGNTTLTVLPWCMRGWSADVAAEGPEALRREADAGDDRDGDQLRHHLVAAEALDQDGEQRDVRCVARGLHGHVLRQKVVLVRTGAERPAAVERVAV